MIDRSASPGRGVGATATCVVGGDVNPFIFSGNEGSLAGLEAMRDLGIGRMVTAAEWKNPKPGIPWALDNGAFTAYRQNALFDGARFERVLRKIPSRHRPVFGVVPDIVAGGLQSLLFSLAWIPRLPHGWPWYLAVQDGMEETDVESYVNEFGGIFVGGTLEWKHRTAEQWVAFGHERSLPVHIGRVGQLKDLAWARWIGADSVDSTSWARHASYSIVEGARAQTTLPAVTEGPLSEGF